MYSTTGVYYNILQVEMSVVLMHDEDIFLMVTTV